MARPREFDHGSVVAQATGLFWQKGYARTSLDDLVEVTGLNRSSLYNAFAGKSGIFRASLDHYRSSTAHEVLEPLLVERGAQAIRLFLVQLAHFLESPEGRRGCMMVNTALMDATLDEDVAELLARHFATLREAIERACREAIRDGDLPGDLEPDEASLWLTTLVRGLLVGAGSGESIEDLCNTIRITHKQLGLDGPRSGTNILK